MKKAELTYSMYIFTLFMNEVSYNTEHSQDGTITVDSGFCVARFDRNENLIEVTFSR